MKLIISYFFLSSLIFSQSIKEDIEKALKSCYGVQSVIQQEKILLNDYGKSDIERLTGQKFFAEEVYLYKISAQNEIQGYAILDNVYGKSMPITFLVMYDKNATILCTQIIRYREPYGGAIQNKKWNDQFSGKNISSEFKVDKDVHNISGATISVHSVTKGIKKLTILLNRYLGK